MGYGVLPSAQRSFRIAKLQKTKGENDNNIKDIYKITCRDYYIYKKSLASTPMSLMSDNFFELLHQFYLSRCNRLMKICIETLISAKAHEINWQVNPFLSQHYHYVGKNPKGIVRDYKLYKQSWSWINLGMCLCLSVYLSAYLMSNWLPFFFFKFGKQTSKLS